MLGFASCETDTDPKLTIPEDHTFVLNAPAFASQYMELQKGNTFELTASQPDYGYAASAQYTLDVALDDKFTEFETIKPADANLARMTFKDDDLAKALCMLHGFDPANYEDLPAAPIYMRAICQIPGVEESRCVSNTIELKQVKFYNAVEGERNLWLIGNVSGWTEPAEANADALSIWTMKETGIGTDVYVGSFTFPAGEVTFRFYSALNGWGDVEASIGHQVTDEATAITLTDNVYEGPCVRGKGSWQFTMPQEDNVNLTVDLKNMTVKFEVGGEVNWDIYPCIWLIGNIGGWTEPAEANAEALAPWRLYDTNGDGIYTTKPGQPFEYNGSDAPMFRFYSALNGWSDAAPSMGSQEADAPLDFTVDADNAFTGAYVAGGKGNWNFTNAPTSGTLEAEVDTNAGTIKVKFTAAE